MESSVSSVSFSQVVGTFLGVLGAVTPLVGGVAGSWMLFRVAGGVTRAVRGIKGCR